MNLSPEDRAAARALFSYPIEFALPGEQVAKTPAAAAAAPVAAPFRGGIPHAQSHVDQIASHSGDIGKAFDGDIHAMRAAQIILSQQSHPVKRPQFGQAADQIGAHLKAHEAQKAAQSAVNAAASVQAGVDENAKMAANVPVPGFVSHGQPEQRRKAIAAFATHPAAASLMQAHGANDPSIDKKEWNKRAEAAFMAHHASQAAVPAAAATPPAASPDATHPSLPTQAAVLPSQAMASRAATGRRDPRRMASSSAQPQAQTPSSPVAVSPATQPVTVADGEVPRKGFLLPAEYRRYAREFLGDHPTTGRMPGVKRPDGYFPSLSDDEREEERDGFRQKIESSPDDTRETGVKNTVHRDQMARWLSGEESPPADMARYLGIASAKPTAAEKSASKPVDAYSPLVEPNRLRRFAVHPDAQKHIEHHGVNDATSTEEQHARLLDAYADFHGKPYMQAKAPASNQSQRQSKQRGLVQPTFGNVMHALGNLGQRQQQAAVRQPRERRGKFEATELKAAASSPAPASSEVDRMRDEFGSGTLSGSMNGATAQGYGAAAKTGPPTRKQPGYKYEAMDNTGLETNGHIYADHEEHARDQLRDQGLFATKLTQHGGRNTAPPGSVGDQSAPSAPIGPHVAKGMFSDAARKSAINAFLNHPDSKEYLEHAGAMEEGIPKEEVWKRIDQAYGNYHQSNPQSAAKPTTRERFAAMLDAAKQGKLKEHLEGGLGNFFQKFDEYGNKFLDKADAVGKRLEPGFNAIDRTLAPVGDAVGRAAQSVTNRFRKAPASPEKLQQVKQWSDAIMAGKRVPAAQASSVISTLEQHGQKRAAAELRARMQNSDEGATHFSREFTEAANFLLAMQFSDGAMRQQSFPDMGAESAPKPPARPEATPLQYVQKQVLAHHIRSLAHEDRDPRNQKLGRGFLNADRLRGVQLSQYEDPSDDHFREMASILSRHTSQVDPKHHKHIAAVASQYDGPSIQPTTGSHERDVINSVGPRAVRLTGVQKRHRAAVESLKQSGAKVNLYDNFLHIDHKGADQEALAQGLAHLRSQGVQAFSRAELDAMAVVLEFTRVKPARNQKSMFDEESIERETSAHDGKKPGEFAPKATHAAPSPTKSDPKPEAPAPVQGEASAGDVGDQLVKSSGLIAHIGRNFGYRDSDLDDFIADVQTRVWKNRDSFDPAKAKFSTWLHVVATNVAHSKHQKSARRNARAKTVSIDIAGDDGSTMAANLKDTHRQSIKLSEGQHQHIHRALMTLPPSERDAFVGVHVNGQSASDYADERGISRQAVSGYLKKATETMRKRLLATHEFSRIKPSKGQVGFAFESEADAKGGYADQPVAPVKSQKSFGWDESKVVRVKTAHDQYKPGEFAPKNESQEAAAETVEETPQPQQTKPGGIPITLENYGQKNRWYALATLPDGTDVTRSDPDPKEARRMAEEAIRERGHEPQREGDATPLESIADAPAEAPAKEEPKAASNATWLEGEARAKHIASLVAKMEAKGFKGASVTDVTPAGYGPSDDKPEPPAKPPVAAEAPIRAPAGDQPGYEGASDKGEAESLPQDEQNATVSRLADFGEKLAGARKDQKWTGVGEGASGKKKSDQPAWRKGYSVNVTKDGKYAVIHDGTGGGRQRQIATFDTPEQAEAMIPMAEVARAHSVKNYGTDDAPNYGIYRNITHRKQPVLKDGFASKDEAMKYMAFNAKSLIETKTALTDSIHPRLEEIVREGQTHRLGGKDADVSDFQKFGFRGVTFGNWNNSPERQHILNHAYDSLTDMADILGVPAKSLSLDGDLGLGFGSHGKGLTGARAHYNRKGVVINLTKMHGAGSLAHEWMHALDHWVGRLNGKASSDWTAGEDGAATVKTGGAAEDDYASSGLRAYGSKAGFRKEVAEAMTQVMSAIKTRPMKYKEDASSHEKYHTQNLETIQRKLDEFRRQMAFDYSKTTGYQHYKGKRGLPASDEVLKQVDELSAKILAGEGGEMIRHGQSSADTPANSRSLKWGHSMAANVAKLSDLHKALRGNKGYSATDGKLSGLVAEIESARTSHATSKGRLADAAEQKEKTKSVRSEFLSEAEKMDRGTKADYWAKDHELAARAFESYIYDKIKGNKGRDDFLAYEKHNDLPEYRMFGVKPYPEASGDERKSINAAFDNLFGVLSSHELSGSRESTKRPEVRSLRKDDGTWGGHWGSKGATEAQLASLKRKIGSREGVVHINKKGSSAVFYTVNSNWPLDKLHAHISEKPGKAFKVTGDDTTSFSRALFAALRTLLPGVEFARNEAVVPAGSAPVMPQPAPQPAPAAPATPAPTKKPRQSRVKLPDISPPQVHYTQAPEFKSWHHGSQVINEDGTPKMVYHGARRADRISGSGKFDPKRATSGPMAFFTDDPEIAKGYATGKQDTSMEMPDNYAQHFKLPVQGYRQPMDIDRAWHSMPHEQRAKIAALAPRISTDDETGENFEVRPEGHLRGNGGYDHAIKEHRGNALKALVDSWLDSGSLYGQEHRFLDVLKHAGVEGAQHHDPHAEYPAIFPMHLSIKNPLHTTAIPDEVHAAIAQAAKRQRGKKGSGADQWDKRHVSGKDFMSRLADDRANNTTHAWTSIPDWVTQTLQQHGYDGIRDNGGKYNQREHSVWIPFQPHQVKSPFNKTFDPAKQKFNFSRDLATAHEFLFGVKVAVS